MADVFISYSKEFGPQTKQLAEELEHKGFTVWYDTSLVPGDSFRDVIMSELAQARAAIVIWTSDSVRSDWVCSEASRARARRILIPVRADDVRSHDIPPPFDSLHTELLSNRSAIEAALAKLGVTPALAMKDNSSAASTLSDDLTRQTIAFSSKPSIAVLPFQNMSGDPEQEYFADGIVEDIITELSRFSELFVIARHSSFQYKGKSVDLRQVGRELGVRYVLEGSIRRSGQLVRVTAQLIDGATGTHRWAERYDRTLDDLFAIQDEIARTIAVVLSAHINKAEAERTLLKPAASWEAYDYFLRGNAALTSFVSRFVLDDLSAARELLQRSIGLDSQYARAYAVLASSHIGAYLTSVNEEYQSEAALQRAFELAHKAVALDPTLPLAHAHLADALLFRRDYDASLAAWRKVFELNPSAGASPSANRLFSRNLGGWRAHVLWSRSTRDLPSFCHLCRQDSQRRAPC
jgi:TolB-like protein